MKFRSNNLSDFLLNTYDFQSQAEFEFRYPVLFEENSFKIDQLNFPTIDTNTGYVYIDGFEVPVHSAPKFDHEISFAMYIEENFFIKDYADIFYSILSDKHNINTETWLREFGKNSSGTFKNTNTLFKAFIIPTHHKEKIYTMIVLENALIKSIGMAGGFMSNSTALVKFDVKMTFSWFHIIRRLKSKQQEQIESISLDDQIRELTENDPSIDIWTLYEK